VRGQAEHIAGLISLASIILLAYVAGNVALELQRFGSQVAGEVLAAKELLEIARVNETHIEIRSRWDGDSWIKYLILCDVYFCNLTSVDTYVSRRGSAVVASLNGSGVVNQICVITANENMFCTDSNTASAQESNQAPPQPRRAWYVVERVPPTVASARQGGNVTALWNWRQVKYLMIAGSGIYLYAYPVNQAWILTELDDLVPALYNEDKVVFNLSLFRVPGPSAPTTPDVWLLMDHDDGTYLCWSPGRIVTIDLGQTYTDGVVYVHIPPFYTGLGTLYVYFGDDPYTAKAYGELPSTSELAKAFWLGSIPGGARYIWIETSTGMCISSIEFYPPQSYKFYIIATDPLVPHGLNAYPRTIMAVAVPGTSLRIIEET